jgi:membrane protein
MDTTRPVGPGGDADRPRDIPRRGWREVLVRTWREMGNDNIALVAAGVAFYGLLAVFPAITALVLIYGLVSDPAEVRNQLAVLRDVIPEDAFAIVEAQTIAVASQSRGSLSAGLIFSLLLSIWSAKKGTNALITALNIAYEEKEERGFIRRNLTELGFTLGGILFMLVALLLVAALPAIVEVLRISGFVGQTTLLWTRWLLMAAMLALVLAVLYRFGPCRSQAKLRWINPGAIAASVLWIAGSIAFSVYVSNFADFNETFGSLGAVIILLMWFFISAFVVCAGAELNAELERQTYQDTTTGPAQPLGERGAYVADNKPEPERGSAKG